MAVAANRGELTVEVVAAPDFVWFDEQLADRHYLGAGRPVGDYLRQVVRVRGAPAALLVWGPACYALKDRDRWLGWSASQRVERLKLIVQNRRFVVLADKLAAPNLASQTLAAALRALPEHWSQTFGHRPLRSESFTDPEAYAGTCYQACNWEAVGSSAGYSRHRADCYVANERPKRLWLFALDPRARAHLRAAEVPAECRPGVVAPPSGVLPVDQPQLLSLFEVLQKAPDPRAKNTRFRIGAVLTLVALALLAGRRDLAAIVRFAQTLHPRQRRLLGLPLRKGTRAFYEVPGYGVFYAVLGRLDHVAFAALLSDWLLAHAGTLPQALAMDGKMIRNHLGLLTLAQHEDGAPQAVAVYDQKEDTARCEQVVATALLEKLPALDGKLITAEALHCQTANARAVVGKRRRLSFPGQRQPARIARAGAGVGRAPGPPFFAQTTCGHGRIEVRALAAFAFEASAAEFPFARSIVVVRSTTTDKKKGSTSTETRSYVSSAEATDYTSAQWQALVRGHWGGVESRNHWRRDAVWGEDRSRTRHPGVLASVALLRNALFALLPEHFPGVSHPEIHEQLHSHPAACLRVLRST